MGADVAPLPTADTLLPAGTAEGVTIVDVDWSVDVVVSSSDLAKVAVPTVLLTLTLSDDRVCRYRLSQEQLHQWRFALAKAVKDAAYLEKKAPPAARKSKKPAA